MKGLIKQVFCGVLNRHEWFVTRPAGLGKKQRVCQRCGLREIEMCSWWRKV
jgi:hypothetical protein